MALRADITAEGLFHSWIESRMFLSENIQFKRKRPSDLGSESHEIQPRCERDQPLVAWAEHWQALFVADIYKFHFDRHVH